MTKEILDHGYVADRILISGGFIVRPADASQTGIPAKGTVTFTPLPGHQYVPGDHATRVVREPIVCRINDLGPRNLAGNLVDPYGEIGPVELPVGAYHVTTRVEHGSLPSFDIVVTADHTETNPLWLAQHAPLKPAPYERFVVNEQVYLDTLEARDETLQTANNVLSAGITATALNSRMTTIETLAGLAPGEVTDAQTANLFIREETDTRAALDGVLNDTTRRVIHGDYSDVPRPAGTRAVEWWGTVKPNNMVDGDVWWQFEPPFTYVETFEHGLTGWTPYWEHPGSWNFFNGFATTDMFGRRMLGFDALSDTATDVEVLFRARVHQQSGSAGAGMVVRASGEAGNEQGYIVGQTHDGVTLNRIVDGVWSAVETIELGLAVSQSFWARLRVDGSQINVRAWPDGEPEPTEWGITHHDGTIPTAGRIGLFGAARAVQQWDAISIALDGATAPTPPVYEDTISPETFFDEFTGALSGWTPRFHTTGVTWETSNGALSVATPVQRTALSLDSAGTTAADQEIVARINLGTLHSGLNRGLIVRGSGSPGNETGYVLGMINTHLVLTRFVNGSYGTITTLEDVTYAANDTIWVRFRAEGNTLSVRTWADGTSEPADWATSLESSIITSPGWVGVQSSASAPQAWERVGVATHGATAPKEA